MVVEEKRQPNPNKCSLGHRCRGLIDWKEADQRVKWGEALWVPISREYVEIKEMCKHCQGAEVLIKTCGECAGTGKVTVKRTLNKYNGEHDDDIVLIAHHTKSNRVSTPRVPTIEDEHMYRAYVDGNREAQERIQEYGLLVLEARAFPGPRECRHRPEFKCSRCPLPKGEKEYVIGTEPADDARTGTGRKYDFGRAV